MFMHEIVWFKNHIAKFYIRRILNVNSYLLLCTECLFISISFACFSSFSNFFLKINDLHMHFVLQVEGSKLISKIN